jgi:hypothetical protein
MRNIYKFLLWQWDKWNIWQRCFIVSAFFGGSAFVAPEPYGFYISMIPLSIVITYILKCIFWDGVTESYQKYQEERASLFETIKTSDKK